jgi:hypothetical protein
MAEGWKRAAIGSGPGAGCVVLDAAGQPRVPGPSGPRRPSRLQVSTCDLIERDAAANGLPVDYFTRLIWRESSFRPWVVSPVGAQGIAQFMPGTAAERGLLDPFDPLQAIPASAQLLKGLAERFGSLGLAAAAYNAGPRVSPTGSPAPEACRGRRATTLPRSPAGRWKNGAIPAPDESAGEHPDEPETGGPDLPRGAGRARCAAADDAALQAAAPPSGSPGACRLPATSRNRGRWPPTATCKSAIPRARRPEPLILRKRNLSLGTRPMVNVRVPAPTREAANDLCRQLRDEGAACIVLKNCVPPD